MAIKGDLGKLDKVAEDFASLLKLEPTNPVLIAYVVTTIAMKASTTDTNYNVGTGKRTSLKELAELLLEITGCDKPINYAPRSQATLVRNRVGCPKKASAEISFTATLDLREGLKRLIEWRASHKAEVAARRKAVGLPE